MSKTFSSIHRNKYYLHDESISNRLIKNDGFFRRFTVSKKNGELVSVSTVTVFKLFILQSVTKHEIPSGISGRYFMSLLFMFQLFLTSTYSSGLATVMTIPRYDAPINSVQEFHQSGIYWGATQEAWITSIQHVNDVSGINQF